MENFFHIKKKRLQNHKDMENDDGCVVWERKQIWKYNLKS